LSQFWGSHHSELLFKDLTDKKSKARLFEALLSRVFETEIIFGIQKAASNVD
jgi:hypothetical protein